MGLDPGQPFVCSKLNSIVPRITPTTNVWVTLRSQCIYHLLAVRMTLQLNPRTRHSLIRSFVRSFHVTPANSPIHIQDNVITWWVVWYHGSPSFLITSSAVAVKGGFENILHSLLNKVCQCDIRYGYKGREYKSCCGFLQLPLLSTQQPRFVFYPMFLFVAVPIKFYWGPVNQFPLWSPSSPTPLSKQLRLNEKMC